MPEKEVVERARKDAREGKAPSTQAGEFVHEEIEHVKEGKHGAHSTKQAIAIGLSKARRAGVKLPPPKEGAASKRTRKQARRDYAKGQTGARTEAVGETIAGDQGRPSTRRPRGRIARSAFPAGEDKRQETRLRKPETRSPSGRAHQAEDRIVSNHASGRLLLRQ